jgi:glycosyltransferase involved in cell wall biosynthesis
MPETPLVSVVIPAFNAASVVQETLESVRAQTFRNFEAVIVDDGSSDGTAAIVRRFCEKDPRFCLIQQDNRGVSAARNAALERARGEFIAFLDADDVWLPEKLARQMELFRADPRANFGYTNFCGWDGRHDSPPFYRTDRPLPDGDTSFRLVFSNVYGLSTVVVRRETISAAGRFDGAAFDRSEDWDYWLRIAERGLWARGTRESLMRYRRWSGNKSSQKLEMAEADVCVLESNLRATQRLELRPLYKSSLAFARGRLELARARRFIESQPKAVPAAIWRAWRQHPRRLKWLMWFALVAWPEFLGGAASARIIHRKLIKKF